MRKREGNCAIKGYQLGGKNKILYTWLWGHPFYKGILGKIKKDKCKKKLLKVKMKPIKLMKQVDDINNIDISEYK